MWRPPTETGALGVHSLDQFVLAVPDANVAQDFYGNFGLDIATRRQHAGDQDLRPRSPLGLDRRRQEQGAASSLVRLLRRGPAAAQGAHRRQRRQADRSAARLREQRLLVPQSRKPSDRGEGRRPRCRPTGRSESQWTSAPARHRRRRHPAELAAGAAAPAVACADLHRDVDASIQFYERKLGLRLSDRASDLVAFMHGIHGSDHHLLAS